MEITLGIAISINKRISIVMTATTVPPLFFVATFTNGASFYR